MKPTRVEIKSFPSSGKADVKVVRHSNLPLMRIEIRETSDGFESVFPNSMRYHHDSLAVAIGHAYCYAESYSKTLNDKRPALRSR